MTLRDRLRSIKPPAVDLPEFDLAAAPDDPLELFAEWLVAAIDGGVSHANAVTLSTASADGRPSARTLLLKDADADGFWFASLSSSGKGDDIAANPRASMTMYWREQSRQVRVSGPVRPGPRAVSEQDFRARHPAARAEAIAGAQSRPMPETSEAERMTAAARELLDGNPDFVPDTWNAYVLEPTSLDFWQATPGHGQLRLGYRLVEGTWTRDRLWP